MGKWVSRTESTLDDQLVPFVRKSLRIFIIFLAVIMTIQNLGYSISGPPRFPGDRRPRGGPGGQGHPPTSSAR